ncbi:MAG: hypothetical protein IKC40_08475 [Oscillospiraceae bacterium]|nr:hypothetical protein [Oscillospiraceae bacterium]
MMKKNLLALLTAICCISACGTMSGSSAWYHFRTKNGGIGYDYQCEMYKGFLVETDGTELTEDMLQGLSGFSHLIPLERFTYTTVWGKCSINYQPEGTAYMVGIDSDDAETLTKLGRSFMLSNGCVTQVRLVDFEKYGTAVAGPTVEIKPKDDTAELNSEVIPELEGFESAYNPYMGYKFTRYHAEECNCALCSDLKEVSQGGYDYYLCMQAFADELAAKYSDLIDSAEARVYDMETSATSTSWDVSIWQSAGDCNADGEVNAQDAAEQLIAAANAATGGEIEITGANDVNADGAVNALDAAAVLAYAAAQGSGQNLSWVQILR